MDNKSNGRPPMSLTESQVRYAMENTYSNLEASKFLNVAYNTYLKYADMYVDSATGKSLRELHKQKVKPKEKRLSNQDKRRYDNGYKEKLDDILKGHYPDYQPRPLRKRLFASNLLPMECASCGWNECRLTDNNYPLYLAFKDGNWRNKLLENIYLLCFNCYFIHIGSQGPYWQGMTYGALRKPRADGRPKGYGGKYWKLEQERKLRELGGEIEKETE